MLNALSVRARAGETREYLEGAVQATLDLVCGPEKKNPLS
jgi:hypothetical protein